ncbi:MAG: hypothetical protein QOH13_2705 [Thermoleophilaceae bacterium]|nr:hypothetical protein [Thermoleophilaceae bacterium]
MIFRRVRVAFVFALLGAAALALAPAGQAEHAIASKSKALPREYKVTLVYTQVRKWTHFYEQRSDCTRTTHGNGQDIIKLTGTGSVGLPVRGGRVVLGLYPAGMTLSGSWNRVGQSAIDRGGTDCGPDGPTTETQPTDGCGTFPITLQFATLEVNPRSSRLTWQSGKSPAFTGNCPQFDGANDVAPGQQNLPGNQLWPLTIRFPARLRDPKRVVANGGETHNAHESCATLNEPCDPDTSYDATASVETTAKVTLVRAKTRH